MFDAIPVERRAAAQAAVEDAFGGAPVESLHPLTGGASALAYRIEVAGRAYVLRLEPPADGLRDPGRGFACMRIAAEAGVAPAVRYTDAASATAIMDLIDTRPLAEHPGGAAGLARGAGELLARLQAAPQFPVLGAWRDLIGRLLGYVRNCGVFAPGLLDPHLSELGRIAAIYPWDDAAAVPSHNDPNGRNLLFDGERLWLVDWETAYRNDPFVDAAIMANEQATTPELETALLAGWLGREASARERARLTVMRELTRLYYAGLIFSVMAEARRGVADTDLSAPTVPEFLAAIGAGRLSPSGPDTLYVLGKMQLAGFRAGVETPAFREALAFLAAG